MDEDGLAARAARYRALGDVHRLRIVDALGHTDRTPSELARVTGLHSNLLAFHLEVLEAAGVIRRTASEGDRRRRYVRLAAEVPRELRTAPPVAGVDRVLFVCTRNASRSQLGAALWAARTGRPALSAGRTPAPVVDPVTVAVARAHGLDLSRAATRGYDGVAEPPDLLITVCDRAGEGELPFPQAPRLHWSVPDPVGGDRAEVEAVHHDLAGRVAALADVWEVAS